MPRPYQDFLTIERTITLQRQGYTLIAYRRLDDHMTSFGHGQPTLLLQ